MVAETEEEENKACKVCLALESGVRVQTETFKRRADLLI